MKLSDITEPTLSATRQEGEPDVLSAVAQLMRNANYTLTDQWLSHPEIVEAQNQNALMQRFLITRNLRVKLGMSAFNTSIERFALDASVGLEEYYANLSTYVIPALIVIAKSTH